MPRDTPPDARTRLPGSEDDGTASVVTVKDPEPSASGLQLSQVAAAALASVTAAVIGSTLGVAGTVIGAAVASVVATVGSAVYSAWLRRGREVVLRTARVGGERLPVAVPVRRLPLRLAELPWKRIAIAAAAALVLGLAALTAVEAVAGKPVSRIGDDSGGGRTTLSELTGGGREDRAPDSPGDQQQRPPQEEPQEQAPEDEAPTEPEPEPTDEPTEAPTEEPTTEEPEPEPEPTEQPTEQPTEAPPVAP